jgi:hypothetical protein
MERRKDGRTEGGGRDGREGGRGIDEREERRKGEMLTVIWLPGRIKFLSVLNGDSSTPEKSEKAKRSQAHPKILAALFNPPPFPLLSSHTMFLKAESFDV